MVKLHTHRQHLLHRLKISLLARAKRSLHVSKIDMQCMKRHMLDTTNAPPNIGEKAFPLQRQPSNLFCLESLFQRHKDPMSADCATHSLISKPGTFVCRKGKNTTCLLP